MNRYLAFIMQVLLMMASIILLNITSMNKGLILGLFGAIAFNLGYYSKRNN